MYVVIGASGFLGAYLIQSILDKTDDKILAVARNNNDSYLNKRIEFFKCDISELKDIQDLNVRIKREENSVKVVFLAAYHHPDMVEKNPRIAWNINITSLSILLNTLENIECFYYASSDSVYGDGGCKKHFNERDTLNPLNRYGKQKALAEQLVNTYGYNVVRYPFLIGHSLVKHKQHFYDEIVKNITQNISMKMYFDSYRSSLDFETAANLLIELMEMYANTAPSIVNISGDQDLSKYDIGNMIAKQLNISQDLIIPVSIRNETGIFDVPRAACTLMDNSLIKKLLNLSRITLELE